MTTSKVTPITRRRDQLEQSIRTALTTTGHATSGPAADVDPWQKSARKVARELGRPV